MSVAYTSFNMETHDTLDPNLLMTSWVVGHLFDNPKCKAYVCMAGSMGYGSFKQSLERGYPQGTILMTNVDVRDMAPSPEELEQLDSPPLPLSKHTLFSLCYCPSIDYYKFALKRLPSNCGHISLISNTHVFPDELLQGCTQMLEGVDLTGMSNIKPLSELGWHSLFDSLKPGGTVTLNTNILANITATTTTASSDTTIAVFSKERCEQEFLRLKVESNLTSWASWSMLARALGNTDIIEVKGKPYNKQQCYIKSIETNCKQSVPWQNVAVTMTHEKDITILGKTYSKRDCHVKALENNMKAASVWNDLGAQLPKNGTVVVNSTTYNAMKCFIQAVNANPKLAISWCNLGSKMPVIESVVVDGKIRTRQECLEMGLGLDPTVRAWGHLGKGLKEGGAVATVSGKKYTKQQCYERGLETASPNDSDIAPLWANLARTLDEHQGVATVGKVNYTHQQCKENARKVNPGLRQRGDQKGQPPPACSVQ